MLTFWGRCEKQWANIVHDRSWPRPDINITTNQLVPIHSETISFNMRVASNSYMVSEKPPLKIWIGSNRSF